LLVALVGEITVQTQAVEEVLVVTAPLFQENYLVVALQLNRFLPQLLALTTR
jgi:hypothetical protein